MPPKSAAPEKNAPTFEAALERLEKIVEEMEGDSLALETLLERYEEGSKLLKVCQEKLESAERKVELITRGASGKPQAAAFDPATVPPTATPSGPAPSAEPPPRKAAPPAQEDDEAVLF